MAGRRLLQPLWKRILRLALYGMNIAGGSYVATSGEVRVLRDISRRLRGRGPLVVLDVGANVGEYAAAALAHLGPDTRVYCFEPSEAADDALRRALGARPNVRILNLGIGERDETVTLYSDAAGSGLASVYERRLGHAGIVMKPAGDIRLTTLDAFCATEGLSHVHLVKLDVEGHELSALRGAARLIADGAIDFIQFEFGGCNIDSRTFFRDFFELLNPRFRLHRVLRDGLAPIDRYDETLEVFLTTNFLAVSRTIE
ncbi:MAG: FkbM family methyltransferase [Planctomycetota bacterium]